MNRAQRDNNDKPMRRPRPGPGPGHHGMSMPMQKTRNVRGTLGRLWVYLRPQRWRMLAVLVLAVLSTVFSILGPKLMGLATTKLADGLMERYGQFTQLQQNAAVPAPGPAYEDFAALFRVQPVAGFDFDYIARILLLLVGLYVMSALFTYLTAYIMSSVSQETIYGMRNDVKDKLDRLPLSYFDRQTHGEILSRVTNDMDNIANTLQQSLTQLITSVVTLAGILVMMLSISPLMTLIALVTLPLCVVVTAIVARYSQRYFAEQQKTLGELNGHVEEMYGGHKIVKVFGHEKDSVEKFKNINQGLYEVGWKAQFMSGIIYPVLNFINNIGYVFVVLAGGLLVAQKVIQIGDVQAFIQYMRQFTHPIIQVANIANILQSTIASAERVFDVLDEAEQEPDREDAVIIPFPKGEVRFEHVKFGYQDDVPLMEDLNIEVRAGQTVAIVGPTGAGKTTLVNLIMRFYEVHGGRISVDGVDIRDMKRGDLRTMFGMVLQDTWLFNGTIRDNIGYGREGASCDEIMAAAQTAHAHHFIMTLPEGYDTVLNEEASNISQGQKQLLTIARAVLADPAILILDEATSNVDTRTEVLIQKAMGALMRGRTSFVIAHRLSTIREADLILVMNHGAIIEQGTHQSLLARGGFYADLYNSQFAPAAEPG